MFHELSQAQAGRVRGLFRPLTFQPFCNAVVAGIYPGRILVDDLTQPETACVLTRDNWVFMAGKPDNAAFNEALNHALWQREIVSEDVGALIFTCAPGDWGGQMDVLCQPHPPIIIDRHHYECRHMAYDWLSALPAEASLLPLTPALSREPGLALPDAVRDTLKQWEAISHPEFADFGFLLVLEGEAAAWATVDGVVDGVGDLGFYTVEAFRRRSLGSLVAAATIDTGLAHGLSHVVWTCNASNQGSVATARKLGLEHVANYQLTYLIFDEAASWAQLGYNHLTSGRYEAALDAYERARDLQDPLPAWFHHDLARVAAGLGRAEEAVAHLEAAVSAGWMNVSETESCPEFAPLVELPAWQTILERMAGAAPGAHPS